MHASVIALLVLLSLGGVSAVFSGALPWHPLQQVSTSETSGVSVDSNENGKVDDADRVNGLSSSDLLASGGGASTPKVFTIVLSVNSQSDCPADFTSYTYAQMAGSSAHVHGTISPDNVYLGSLDDWNPRGQQSMFFRVPVSWGGFICWKTYTTTSHPVSSVISINRGVACPTGYRTLMTTPGGNSPNFYSEQSDFGLFLGKLDYWGGGEWVGMVGGWNEGQRDSMLWAMQLDQSAEQTCWKVDNLS